MAAVREVTSLPLAPSVIEILSSNGFRTVSDVIGTSALDLAQELQIGHDLALEIIQSAENSVVKNETDAKVMNVTAKDLLGKFGTTRGVLTFCKRMDTMLNGGIPIGQISEFCGVPGVGKTQLGIQLSVNIQIPEIFGGIGGEAVYIDTEGSFMVERVAEVADVVSKHLLMLAQNTTKKKSQESAISQLAAAQGMTRDRILEGIHVFRAHDQTELLATINRLPSFLRLHTKVRLLVVDSIAFHFRQDLGDTSSRSRVLSGVAQTLNQVAYEHSLAVVVINHVTTRFERTVGSRGAGGSEYEDGFGEAVGGAAANATAARLGLAATTNEQSGHAIAMNALQRLVPALGEQWSHCITNRVMLHWYKGVQRRASLVKSPSLPFASAPYIVCERGIRDVEDTQKEKRKHQDISRSSPQVSYTPSTPASDYHVPPSAPPVAAERNTHVAAHHNVPASYFQHQDYHQQQQMAQQYQHMRQQQQQAGQPQNQYPPPPSRKY